MKEFDITYRAKDGKQEVIRISAEDPKGVFAELQNRGLSALRVEEAKGKTKKPPVSKKGKSSSLRILGAMLLFLCIAAICVSAFLSTNVQSEQQAKPRIKVKGKLAEVVSAPAERKSVEVLPPSPPPPVETNVFVKRPGALELPSGKVVEFIPPPSGEVKTIWVQGQKYVVDSEGNFENQTPQPIFDNQFENTMAAMSTLGPGVLPGLALSIPQNEVAKYLASPIIINDDDPEEVVQKKIATADMKEMLKQYIKEGGSWEEFVMELSHIKQTENLLQVQAISEIAKMLIDDDEEGAQLYREKVDQFMKSKGYNGLKVPEKWGLNSPQPTSVESEN